MIFTKLKLNYFGRFQNHEIVLKPGINLIYGENEAGKSTIHTFIRGMLFGIERLRGRGAASKEDVYTRYLPWDYPGAYGGSMDIRIEDKEYRLLRSFHANDKSFTLIDLSTGREIKLKEGQISELVPGLTEATFRNTISIEQQKAATDHELAVQVRNYITNLSIAKSKEVNVAKAVSTLTEQRKQLEASQNTEALKQLQCFIEDGIAREERMDQLTLQLRELLHLEQELSIQILKLSEHKDQELEKQMEQLPAILEKYSSYLELDRQEKLLLQQEQELGARMSGLEKELKTSDVLQENIAELQQLKNRLYELEKNDLELLMYQQRLNKRTWFNLLVSLAPSIMIGLCALGLVGLKPYGILLLGMIFAVGGISFFLLNRLQVKKQRTYRLEYDKFQSDRAIVQTRIQNILRSNNVTNPEELMSRREAAIRNTYVLEQGGAQLSDLRRRRVELEDSRDYLYETIMRYMQQFISEDVLSDWSMKELVKVISSRKQETADRHAQMSNQQNSLKLEIERLRWEISKLEGNEDELLKNKEKYADLQRKHKETATRLEAIRLALSSIQELSVDIHDTFGQQLSNAVTSIIREITGSRYNDLKVDEKLEVKVGRDNDYVFLDRLSAGTIDQIYFALRLTVADLLLEKNEVPLLLDDSFALYDEKRVKAVLKELAGRNQVIIFTCHRREQQLLKELGIDYHLVELIQC